MLILLCILYVLMHFHNSSISEIYIFDKIPFCLPFGKADDTHLHRYQGLAVDDYGFALDALDLGHPQLSLS